MENKTMSTRLEQARINLYKQTKEVEFLAATENPEKSVIEYEIHGIEECVIIEVIVFKAEEGKARMVEVTHQSAILSQGELEADTTLHELILNGVGYLADILTRACKALEGVRI